MGTQPPAAASAQARLSMEASRLDKHNYAPSTKFIIGLSQLGPTAASRGSAHARQRTITTTTPPPNALESAPANTTTQTCPASCTRHRAGSDSESRRLLFSLCAGTASRRITSLLVSEFGPAHDSQRTLGLTGPHSRPRWSSLAEDHSSQQLLHCF